MLLWAVIGCAGWEAWEAEDLRWIERETTTGSSGSERLAIEVEPGETAFLLTARLDWPYRAFVLDLEGPGGELLYEAEAIWEEGAHSWTGAVSPEWATTLNWPVLDAQEPLEPGRYRARVGVIDLEDFYVRRAPLTATVAFKADPEPASGVVHANLVLVDDLADDTAARAAIEAALPTWRAIYGSVGLSLEVSWSEYQGGPLMAPGEGSREAYEAIAAASPPRSVNVVFVDLIEDSDELYGLAGHIPGPLVPSIHSAVTISMLVNSGADGVFTADEERLLGETIAHEVGHQLGLFHPVETTWSAWDALDDTPECATQVSCTSRLGRNLMFPYPVCTDDGCAPQDELSDQQGRQAHRYVGVR